MSSLQFTATCGTYFRSNYEKNDGLSYNNYSHNYVHSLQNVIVRARNRKAAEFFYVGPARHCVFINVHGPPVCKSAQLSRLPKVDTLILRR